MIRFVRHFLAALGLSLCLAGAQAQLKLAVINYTNVFDGFWKTKQANVQLRDSFEDYQKTGRGMQEEYRKANEEYRKLIESANDPAVSADERDKRKKTAESKLIELREIEQSMAQLEKTADNNLSGQRRRLYFNIDREIREEVSKRAKAGGYNVVLNSSSLSANAGPVFLYAVGLPDLTDEVLNELNRNAPAGALDASKAEEKPGEKKEDKK
jgi:outer membrane protein